MWYLCSKNDQRTIYIAGQNKEVTIGRNADTQTKIFVITEDPSISRKHAILTNLNNELFLQDLGSRYGTFINDSNDKIESNTMIKLKAEDVVKFGKMGSTWRVHVKRFITCTSTLKGENLLNLKECLNNMSGVLKNEWDDNCMFLTMPAITLTMKVVLALVQGAHIVTVDYWNKCLEAVNSQVMLPDPKNFTPQIIESTLNKEVVSFLPDNQRQNLFVGKKVIFFSKRQFEMYKSVILKASATPLLLSESKMTKSMLCENDVIVIQYNIAVSSQETQTQKSSIQDIVNYIKSKGKRLVTDVEIGLAILYCSTEKYCNPDFNFPSEVIKQTESNSKTSNVLAQESQEPTHQIQSKKENLVINESLLDSLGAASSKRKACDDNDKQENSHKKLALDATCTSTNTSMKRKSYDDNNETDVNPTKKIATELPDSNDCFNFINTLSNNKNENQTETSKKRLNLAKPQKRKLDSDDNEDDLFQFIKDKSKIPATSKTNIFDTNKVSDTIESDPNSDSSDNKSRRATYDINVDLSSLRGSKLEELMKHNENLLKSENFDACKTKIKEEELEEKMSHIDLGTTIVKVRKDLIVKKEAVHQVEAQPANIKNFKKFKKVWPVKMQVTVIPRSTLSVLEFDNSVIDNKSSLKIHNDSEAY